jgi:hypothetical protein
MKIKLLLFVFTALFLGSCTLTKRYHSIGYQVDWKSNKNIVTHVKKSNPIAVNKSAIPLLANKSLVEITEYELSPIKKSVVQQSLPIEQNSIARAINVIKTNTHKVLPPDSTKIVKIAALKQKMKKRFKRLGIYTSLVILIPKIINWLDGDNSSSNAGFFETNIGAAMIIALIILILAWVPLFFIAVITGMVYLIYKLSYNINH